jgi:hypothetical protein
MTKATRTTIEIGPLEAEGFMPPDGSYRFSQASAAEAIGKSPVNALRFLGSNTLKALLGEGYTDYTPEAVEIETQPDVQRNHIAALEAQIKALGAEPWQPPAIEE